MRYTLLARALLAASALAAACGDDDEPACPADAEMIGDPSGAPEIEIGELRSDGAWVPLPDEGAALTLFTPPQGGKIALVGARIHNMSGCRATTVGRLRDPTEDGEPVAAREGRTLLYRPMADRPDWGEADAPEALDRGPNVNTCFNYQDRDMDGCAWTLHVSVEDRDGRRAEKRIPVTPVCLVDDPLSPDVAQCECECAARYDTRVDACNDLDPWRDAAAVCD